MANSGKRNYKPPNNNKGKIFSINISKKRGTTKLQVQHAILRKCFGLVEDAHAGLNEKQVSLLSWEAISKQQKCPKIRDKKMRFKPGDFAENISTLGLNMKKLKIGDHLRINKKIILEITQIGKKCHNYCRIFKTAGSCIMPKQGIFTKVISGGRITVNNPIYID